jgi:hypothetical protein
MKAFRVVSGAVLLLFVLSMNVFPAHPLITDDAGTQGKGHLLLELNTSFIRDKETEGGITIRETAAEVETVVTYGVTETIDLVATLPYVWSRVKVDGAAFRENGIADASMEVKWRFFDASGFSLAVKPGISFPTGDEEKGLGAGKVGYSAFLIGSKALDPWAFHANLGYLRNENVFDERENLWHASIAAERSLNQCLTLVGNVGVEANPDRATKNSLAFGLAGLIYSVTERLDLNAGFKLGLSRPESDHSLLLGAAYKF